MKITKFRKLLAGLALAGATIAQPLAADCCNPCDWDGCWDLGVEALYWRPIGCTLDYAFRGESIIGGIDVIGYRPDYEWGVRVKGSYTTDCWFGELSYLYLSADDSLRLSDVTSLIFDGSGDLLTKFKHEYQNVDLRLGFTPCCGCKGYAQFFANARWAYLRQRIAQGFVTGTFPEVQLGSEFNGGGVGVGAKGRYAICGNFGLNGHANILALIGERKTSPLFLGDFVHYTSHVNVVPEIDFRVAFDYQWSCQCATVVFELGYELNYFLGAFERSAGGLEEESILKRECEDAGFAGPFIGLKALF